MTVIGVGLFAVFEALLITSDLSDQLRNEETAQRLAERHITSILAKPVSEFGTQKGTEERFNWEETTRASRHPNLMEVTVKVQWTQQGKSRDFQLVSLRHINSLSK